MSDTSRAMAGAMSDMPGMSPHMTMTPYRAPVPGDSARAQQIVTQLRASIAKYRDVNVALAEGFKPFLPNVKQDVYHFDARVPLSIYPWHLHTDLRVPPRDQPARWRELEIGGYGGRTSKPNALGRLTAAR
ncbi:MAG: hypothetical protein ACREND_03940 [Gemmatimonadaceae bacterium]